MARYNEILVGRYNRMVQKLLSMKGGASLVTLADEAIAVFPLFYGAENRYLEGWDRFAISASIAAGGAGNQTVVQFRNPAASNVIAVLEKVLVAGQAADTVLMKQSTGQADLTTLLVPVGLDTRGRSSSTCIGSMKNATATANPGSTILIGATTANSLWDVILFEEEEIPVLPNESYGWSPSNLNEALFISFVWRERFLEDSERA